MKVKRKNEEDYQISCSITNYWKNKQKWSKWSHYTKDKMEGAEMPRSRGELKIEDILVMNGMTFKTEYIFPDLVSPNGRPLRFDFAIFDDDGNIDFLIEFQGEQHYTSVAHFGGKKHLFQQKYNDNKKRIYCAHNELTLVAIPHWDYDAMTYDYIMNKAYGE